MEKGDGTEWHFTGTIVGVTDLLIREGEEKRPDWLLHKMCDTPKFLKT